MSGRKRQTQLSPRRISGDTITCLQPWLKTAILVQCKLYTFAFCLFDIKQHQTWFLHTAEYATKYRHVSISFHCPIDTGLERPGRGEGEGDCPHNFWTHCPYWQKCNYCTYFSFQKCNFRHFLHQLLGVLRPWHSTNVKCPHDTQVFKAGLWVANLSHCCHMKVTTKKKTLYKSNFIHAWIFISTLIGLL